MRSLIAVLAVLALGCASAEVFRSTTKTFPEVPQDEVLLFFSVEDIKVPYELVGQILMGGASGWGSDCNDLVKKAQKKAGQMGANAIVAQDCNDPSGASKVMSALFSTQDNKVTVTAYRLDYGTDQEEEPD